MFISPTPPSIQAFIDRQIAGPLTMLNLLRFRDVADYTATPELEPETPVSGEQAYDTYAELTMPHLAAVGGSPVFMGTGGPFLIGPEDVAWDRVLLVRYPDVQAFLSMTQNPGYLAGAGHRMAALADSRLLPIE
ncbi:MAG: DUF1330 domain-containing protein [Actinomycetota bacterium]